nr:T9SS type A sorting domain-containing protein [uncultured Flavobacterium sp.]
MVQSAKNGTGSGLTWSNLSAGTGYYVIGTGAAPTSCTSTSAPANVAQINNPAALLLTGHDFCASAPNTGSITSSTSVSGVSYQLYNSSDAVVQSAKNGTGSGLTWSNLSAGTGYYVIGTGAAPTSCTSTSAPTNVAQINNPAALLLTGHDFCASAPNTGSITSSTSVSGVSYQLYDSSDAVVQSAKNGTGSGLTWSNLSAGTGYYVIGTGAAPTSCTSTSAPANVAQINNPAALLLTGHDFCASAPNTGSITSSTSVSGVSYQLYDSSDAVVQSAKNGTGNGLTWSNLSAGTGYYVIGTGAAPTSCTSTSAPANVVQVTNPTALLLTGHDFCASAPNTGSITSSTSVSGVSYQLYNSSNAVVQSAKNGTGSGLTWSNLSAGTGYYVIGTGAAPTSCTSTSAPANVVQINNPVALLLTGHDFCSSSPNTGSITSSTSVSGVSYQLYNSSDAVVQSAKNGTGSGLTWSNLSAGTGYYVIGTGAAPTSCTSTSAPANVVQNQTPILVITTPTAPCTPGKVNLTVNAVTANSTLPSGTVLTYYNDNNGAVGTQMTNTQAAAVGVGTYWIKATSLANCTDIKSVTIAVNNCGGLIYPTQTTCTSYLNNQPPLDKICFTVTKKGSKSTISNATPGVFFYYATIIAPSNGNLTIEVLQFNTSSPHVKEFAIQQDQVFLFDNNCTKIATGKEAPKGSGQATVTIPNAIKDRTYVISVKYDTKTIISQTAPSADYQSYFISKVNGNVVNSTAGNILVSNCSAPTAPTAVVKTADTIAPTDVTTTSKIKPADFTAYPVPFKDQLTIRYNFDYKSDVKIEVFNALGIMVLTKHDADGYLNKEVLLDLTNAGQEGIYIVKVSTNRGSSTKKVISSR